MHPCWPAPPRPSSPCSGARRTAIDPDAIAHPAEKTRPPRDRASAEATHVGWCSDVELFARVARGDQHAFATLYDRHCRHIYGLVLRVLRDHAHAEEVTQEVFVQAWRSATRYDPGRGAPATWLRTLGHRRAVDRVRAEQAARIRDHHAAATQGASPLADPVGDGIVIDAERAAVRAALAALTDLQREAVTLAYFGGHTYRRVAELLGIPTSTAKSRIRDGLIRLRDTLEPSLPTGA